MLERFFLPVFLSRPSSIKVAMHEKRIDGAWSHSIEQDGTDRDKTERHSLRAIRKKQEGNGNRTGRVALLNGRSKERKPVLFYDAYCILMCSNVCKLCFSAAII